MTNEDMPMRDEMPMRGNEMEPNEGGNEAVSAFVPTRFFRKEPKVGDLEKVKIVDIDPETGDVEIQCVYGEGEGSKSEGYEADFDRAMPEESE